MAIEHFNISNDGCSRLSSLLSIADSGTNACLSWSPQDLMDILEHFLSTRVRQELVAAEKHGFSQSTPGLSDLDPCLVFSDLLLSSTPDLKILSLVKEYAKIALHRSEALLPNDVAKVVYIASIAAAYGAGCEHFSSLDYADFERAVRWCLAQGWVTQSVRQTLRRGIANISGAPEGSGHEHP